MTHEMTADEMIINRYKDILLKVTYDLIVATEQDCHSPDLCPKKEKRQDPMFCPQCHPWLRPYGTLTAKIKNEIWDRFSIQLDPIFAFMLSEKNIIVEDTNNERIFNE